MVRDVQYAIRSLRSAPAVTLAALVVLSVGIGATTAIFSVANSVLFRPIPFADPERLVQFGAVGILEFRGYREHSRSFAALAYYSAVDKDLHQTGAPERIWAVAAEPALFDLLGVHPLAGRTFTGTDALNVAVASEAFWRRRFGAIGSVGDRRIVLDGEPYTVIGIMPASFQFPYRTTRTDVWLPAELPRSGSPFQRIDVAVGRLKPDVTIDAARAELDAIARRLGMRSGSTPPSTVTVVPLAEAIVGRSRTAVLTLLGAVVMVLLIACANVANLMLARAETRKREVAVRIALGAGRGRLVGQFLTEGLLLACAASAAAILIALAGTPALSRLATAHVPRAFEIGLDWRALLFLLAVGVSSGIAFGLVPARYVMRPDVAGGLNATASRSSRDRGAVATTKALVIAEIALAFILLAGAGLLFRAFLHLQQTPTGITADHVLTLRMETRSLQRQLAPVADSPFASSAQGRYFRAIEERVQQVPGVRAAGFVTRLHVQSAGNTAQFTIVGRPPPPDGRGLHVRLREASPGYFRALGIPLRAGRWFTEGEPGVIVNEALVREHFGGDNPIGRVLSRGPIVGVVADVRQNLRVPAEPEIYNPLGRTSYLAATLVVNAHVPPEDLVASVRPAIHEISPNQTVFDVRTMRDVIKSSYSDVDLSLSLIGLFAALAFALSIGGIYAVLSYAVVTRRKELGIRLALGADPGRLLRDVLAQGGRLVAAGVTIGVAGALIVTRLLRALLYEVTPTDPLTFTAAGAVLMAVAMMACLNPARRAMKVDPLVVLRHE